MKVSVAKIKKPRGFKGELAALLYRPHSRTLRVGLAVTLKKGESAFCSVVQSVKYINKRVAIKLEGVDDEVSAAALSEADVLVEQDELEPLGNNEFYHFEIEGMQVFFECGELIGIVDRIDSAAGNDLLYIKCKDKEVLVPFVKEIVKEVDKKRGRITIKKIEGLLD